MLYYYDSFRVFLFFFFLFQREIKRRSRQQSNKLSPTVSIFVWTDAKKSTDSHPRPHFRHSYRVEFRSPPVRIPFARGFCKQSRARWKRNCRGTGRIKKLSRWTARERITRGSKLTKPQGGEIKEGDRE